MNKVIIVVVFIYSIIMLIGCNIGKLTIIHDTINDKNILLYDNEYLVLNYEITVHTEAKPIWVSDNPDVVSITADGFVTAESVGEAVITLRLGKLTDKITVRVLEYIKIERMEFKKDFYKIKRGTDKALELVCYPENAIKKNISYLISPNDGNVSIDDFGKVTVSQSAVFGSTYTISAVSYQEDVSTVTIIEISALEGYTAWTIGDSIFDFNDNSPSDMVQQIVTQTGFSNLYKDNIAGSTVTSASGVGIIEHIINGTYNDWEEPDIIIIQRGTNDCYHWSATNLSREKSLEDIENVMIYFRSQYPNIRIIWSTVIWRYDVNLSDINIFNSCLVKLSGKYNIEVLRLDLVEEFSKMNSENYKLYLYDGIHPNSEGQLIIANEFIKYINKK